MKLKEGGWCERKGSLRDDGHYTKKEKERGKHQEEMAKNVKVCKVSERASKAVLGAKLCSFHASRSDGHFPGNGAGKVWDIMLSWILMNDAISM